MIEQSILPKDLEQQSSDFSSDFQIVPKYERGLDQPYSYVGILIVEKENTLQLSISTAFLLNEFCIIACSHSFESKSEQFIGNKIIFIPNCNKKLGSLVYQQNLAFQLNVYSTQRHPTYKNKRVSRQLTLIFLKNPIHVGIPIPSIINWKLQKYLEKNISIVGFRKSQIKYFPSSGRLQEIQIEKVQFSSNSYSIDKQNHEIRHYFQTTSGMSGSPIYGYLRKNGKVKQVILGFHTHKSNIPGKSNLGILFSDQIQKIISEYIQKYEQARERQSDDQSKSISSESEE